MGKILNIETTTTNCSVALGENGNLIAVKEDYNNKYSHAERLHIYIEEILQEASWRLDQLDAIAVSKGPGSYTGLRIGVSAAKGLCYAQDLPLVAVSTLEALSRQVIKADSDYIVPMLDARRMEVYSAVFSKNGTCISDTEAKILNDTSFASLLDSGRVAFIGNGVEKFKEICRHPNAVIFEDSLPSARDMVPLSEDRLTAGKIEDVAYFEPFYLKDFLVGGKKS